MKHLKLGGRLVAWIPIYKKAYSPSNLPQHPCLRLVSNSEQKLTEQTSRRLLSWEKISEIRSASDHPRVIEMFPLGFREHYFGRSETRKQRRARLIKEQGEKAFYNCSKTRIENSKT